MGRPLTQHEVKALPLPLRCCHHLQSWTASMPPASVEDWARRYGWRAFTTGEDEPPFGERERAITRASFEAMRLYAFAKDIIDQHDAGFW